MASYKLKNNRLKINIVTDGETYNGSRFDHMGMITEVTLDDKDKFCSKESLIEGDGSGGEGFFNEFGIEEPIGYDETKVGEKFPKIGVGLLTKEDEEPYNFFKEYKIDQFGCDVKLMDNSITLQSKTGLINGYSLTYIKTISIEDNEMRVKYSLENTGEKVINTTEYCHNFVAINDNTIGPDYSLKFSYPIDLENKVGNFEVNYNEITWNTPVEKIFYCRLKNFSKEKQQYFELIHKPSKVGFRETSDFTLERVALWGMPHVVSPEAFVKIEIKPGEKQIWTRIYKFFN